MPRKFPCRKGTQTGRSTMRYFQGLTIIAAVLALGACATATVVPVGNTRAPIDPSQVRLYAQPPAHYEVVAILNGNSGIEGTAQGAVNDVIDKLKEQAAKLGANGVLIGKMGQQYSGSWGGASYMGWGTFSSSSLASYSKTIDAQAIYVPDQQAYGAASVAMSQPAGAWPLQLPQFDTRASCQAAGGDVTRCIDAEYAAHAWLANHTTTVQIAGDCSAFAQQTQSYTMIQACVRQREGAQRQE
jgi:hypothetical protein